MNVIFDDKKDICKNLQSAIRGWKPFVLADEVWGSLAIGLVIKNNFCVGAEVRMDLGRKLIV